jgi:hypothetical protein
LTFARIRIIIIIEKRKGIPIMAINIRHTYSTHVEIIFYPYDDSDCSLHENTCGNMDDIAEHCCEILVKHNFAGADVCSAETGEVLMVIERT